MAVSKAGWRRILSRVTLMSASALLAPAVAAEGPTTAPVTYIHAGHLLDRPGRPMRGNSTVVIQGGKVLEVREGFQAPAPGAGLIDLSNRYVLPGLIDLHVHLQAPGTSVVQNSLNALNKDDADLLIFSIDNAKTTLLSGFTTIRDLGAKPRLIRALREAIDRGDIVGPNVINSGSIITVTGGHGDPSNGVAEDFADVIHQHEVNICDSADDCRRAVREQVRLGAKVIKFAATGGVLSNVSSGLGRAMTPEEIKAIVDTAHALGRRVAVHSHGSEGTEASLEAGVDTVEHGTVLTDKTIALFKSTGAYFVPTMLAQITVEERANAGKLSPAMIPKAHDAYRNSLESHKKAIRSGIKIAFGTDTGVSPHGDNAREFELLVNAGMPRDRAIYTATTAAADALGMSDSIGSIEPGKTADIIAVAGNPLENISELRSVKFVMKHGEQFKKD